MLSRKYLIGAVVLLMVVAASFSGLKVSKAQFDGYIKVGVFAPMDPDLPHWISGFLPAAELAAKQINDSGGVPMGGKRYAIQLFYRHEPYDVETNENWQTITLNSIKELVEDCGVDLIIGGFRTECTELALEKIIEYNHTGRNVPFYICGAADNGLCYHAHGLMPGYDRYDYIYRVMPTNGTALLYTYSGTVKGYLLNNNPPGPLLKLFGEGPEGFKTVKVAIVMEKLNWTNTMWYYLVENPTYRYGLLGLNHTLVYSYRLSPSPAPGEIDQVLNNINASGARLLLHVFSAPVGYEFIKRWGEMHIPALPVGINVMSQAKEMWYNWTFVGNERRNLASCEYESHLMAMGTKTPITDRLVKFWNDFESFTGGKWPLYTGYGIYITLINLNKTLNILGTLDPEVYHKYVCPLEGSSWYSDDPNGRLMFTSIHDIFSRDFGPVWPEPHYVRSMTVQWLDGRLEVVCPTDQTWSKAYCLPPWEYPMIYDSKNYDGVVGVDDIVYAAQNYGARPGDARWDHRSDVRPMINWGNYTYGDDVIGVDDIVAIAGHYGDRWPNSYTVP